MADSNMLLSMLEILSALFILAVGIFVLVVIVLYVLDKTQTRHAVRRNYPVIGRFRYLFEYMGEFFRQYFFSQDREEMPFNRAQRSWCYRAAKNIENTVAFGSSRDLRPEGTVIFVNHPYPVLKKDAVDPAEIVVGAAARIPFRTKALFSISGMSYGALSRPAVEALSAGAALAGCWLNTGEGGTSPFHLSGGCDLVVQIGTAKYGVRNHEGTLDDGRLKEIAAHEQVRMFEIKMAQGAKPGKGGMLPGAKVTEEISKIRGIPEGVDSISPNRHPEIDSVDHLLDMIAHVREVTGKPTGIKIVIGGPDWLNELVEAILRRGPDSGPDFITIDGAEGGTGAAPMPLMDSVGLPLFEALPMVADALIAADLKRRTRVIASGKLITPVEVAWALCAGADFVVSARGFMFALGCIQAMQCNKNTCPTGITTHDPDLQWGLVPGEKKLRVANYCRNMINEVGIIAHACGLDDPRKFRREHARVVVEHGRTLPLSRMFPYPSSMSS